MLRSLSIRNHSLIDSLELELEAGMTVITGETGAGKSIVLDALGLALGNRADAHALRTGAERLEVSALFELSGVPAVREWLRERELDQGNDIQLRRVLTRDGRSRAWINGQSATLSEVKAIGDLLVDMHGQHEHHSLLRRPVQQQLLDAFGGHLEQARRVHELYDEWRACRDELEDLHASSAERGDRLQLLEYQLRELDELDPREGELESLESEQRMLANASTLAVDADALLALCDEDQRDSLARALRQACSLAERLRPLGPSSSGVRELFESALIQVEEARRDLGALRETIEINPERLALVDERLAAYQRIARKHRIEPAQIPSLSERLGNEASLLRGNDERLEVVSSRLTELERRWTREAAKLSTARHGAVTEITDSVHRQLASLGMENCRFSVQLSAQSEDAPAPGGAESAEFLVATNPGSPALPLARVVSGGELSRISLAIQVVTAGREVTPTVIFDEVDVGVGGATAEAVGGLLQKLGARAQVLCVTHLPQVAARGDRHLVATKRSAGDSTSVQLATLDTDQRVEEIARMLGGRRVTATSREHAMEMLESANAV